MRPISLLTSIFSGVGLPGAARFLRNIYHVGYRHSPTGKKDPYEVFDVCRGLCLLATHKAIRQELGQPLTLSDIYRDSTIFQSWVKSGQWRCPEIITSLIAHSSKAKSLKILDVGCHQGNLIKLIESGSDLSERIDSYYGVDLSRDAVQIAIRLHPNHTFIEGDALMEETYKAIPLNNNVVVCSGVCDFFSPREIRNLLKNIDSRFSREDDSLIFISYQTTAPNYGVPEPIEVKLINREQIVEDGIVCYKGRSGIAPSMYKYDPQEFKKLVESCGFEIVEENSQSDTSGLIAVYDIVCLRRKNEESTIKI